MATELTPRDNDLWTASLGLKDLYFVENDASSRNVLCYGMDGDFVKSGRVLLEASNTDWALLLLLMYRNSIADAVADLGQPGEISKVFTGFQKYLYQQPFASV